MKDCEIINNCMLCNSCLLKEVISFGKTPLANELFNTPKKEYDLFDLTVMFCNDCGHCQLKTFVNEERLYRNYVYVSGTNTNNILHFKSYAEKIMNEFFSDRFTFKLNGDNHNLIIEIASNDGTFLKFFDGKIKKVGIDPAKNLVSEAAKNGVKNIPVFFNEETAKNEISKACNNRKAQIIVANNVFAHNKDLDTIIKGIKFLLDDNGTFIFENSYLLDILDKGLLDVFYHEHMHTHSITPLVRYFNKFGMSIYRVERLPNHGGSIRVYVCNSDVKNIESSVNELLKLEENIYDKFLNSVNKFTTACSRVYVEVDKIKKNGKTVSIYGVPAKATTLMYAIDLEKEWIEYAIDDNPLKQNTFMPGSHIPVYNSSWMKENPTDYVLILAWNFADSIIKNNTDFKGKWIVPIPDLKVI